MYCSAARTASVRVLPYSTETGCYVAQDHYYCNTLCGGIAVRHASATVLSSIASPELAACIKMVLSSADLRSSWCPNPCTRIGRHKRGGGPPPGTAQVEKKKPQKINVRITQKYDIRDESSQPA